MDFGGLLSLLTKVCSFIYRLGELQAQSLIGERRKMLMRVKKRKRAIGKEWWNGYAGISSTYKIHVMGEIGLRNALVGFVSFV
ncbi:hypothetical protein M441DRAFT_62464 [Trichoderma asperellum CBS 433.97]|uniref:Uncharacterized protein n=1 Tax=Trichoderma asperellum (strain ATCC 204424 / CBS 433.97 / NBRC 101777) TaxID=1042311 RepID=A0A2T3YT07_TRIA4|nr:hypothetical protein M441DRAFT_62464 [Trichoderma asperellum CBS 433.97]PTB35710.1 hypothetical protein M441DRAFT_62464 [Trichoderma asperellum CBS 433.97]